MAVFHPIVAIDRTTGELVASSSGLVYDEADPEGTTPLAVTDLSGVPWPGGLVPVVGGLVMAFDTGESGPSRVWWSSGPNQVFCWSPGDMEASATAAATSAAGAAAVAVADALVQIETTVAGFLAAEGYAPVLVAESVEDIPVGLASPTVVVIPGELVDPGEPEQDPVVLRGWHQDARSGTTPTTLSALVAGAQPGDWMIAVMVGANSAMSWSPPDGGWTQIVAPTSMGTRRFQAWARQWVAEDPATFEFTPSVVAANRGALAVLGNADDLAEWVVGSVGLRSVTGTSTTNVAPAVTTTTASMVVTVSAEATTADDTIAASVTAGGAVDWFWTDDAGGVIETVFAATLAQAEPGVTLAVTVTYQNAQTSNGLALQIAVPPVPVP